MNKEIATAGSRPVEIDRRKQAEEAALGLWNLNHTLVKRLFTSMPAAGINVRDINFLPLKNADGRNKKLDIYNYVAMHPKGEILKRACIQRLAYFYCTEVLEKGIYPELFIKGAISYGFCDQIAYYGETYLDVLTLLISRTDDTNNLINWAEVDIKVYINNIEDLYKQQKEIIASIKADNSKDFTSVGCAQILNWNPEYKAGAIIFNREKNPYTITSAIGTYRNCVAHWNLDFPTIKNYHDARTRKDVILNPFATRPVNIAEIKVAKALAKKFYGRRLLTLGLNDGDEEEREDVYISHEEAWSDPICEAKEDFARHKLSNLGGG